MDEFEQRIVKLAEMYKPDEFIHVFEDAPLPQEEKGDFFLEVGTVLYRFSYFSLALNSWNHALKYFLENKDRSGESTCYTNLGVVYNCLGDFRKAIGYLEKSLKIMKEIGNRSGESACYTNLGNVFYNLGDFTKSIEYLENSLKIAKEIGDRSGESKCYAGLGNAFYSLGDFTKAIEYYEKSLKIMKEISDRSGESKCYTNLGNAFYSLGDFTKSIEYLEKSLTIAKEIGDRSGESTCYTNLGIAYENLGDFTKAIGYYENSLKIDKEIGDRFGESKCYAGLGNAYHNLGDFRKAIVYLENSLTIKKEIGDRSGESKCYTNLGIVYDSLGDFTKAIGYHEKSLTITKEIGDRSGESTCYTNLGIAYGNLGDFTKAIEYYEKSLTIMKETGGRHGESKCYTNLGNAYDSLGDFTKAIEYLEKSLTIAKEIGDRSGESACYTNLGNAFYSLGDFTKAIEYHEKSLTIAKETGDINSERIATLNLCRVYYESEKELAYEYCKNSIELSEMISGRLVEEEKKLMFSTQTSDTYQLMILLCLNLKKEKEAFEYTERSKSRAFLDMLTTTEIRPTVEVTSKLRSLLAKEEKNLAKLREIQTRHLRPAKAPVEPGKVEQIHEKLTQTYNEIEKYDPEYVYVRKGKPLTLDNMQDMLSSQKRDVVLIEYFMIGKIAIIFVISSKDDTFYIKTVSLSQKDLNKYTENYLKRMAYCSLFKNIDKTSLELGKYLIDPVSDYLAKGDLIYFVPYGPLHYIPLHAVELRGEPLIKRHPVVYAPSASIIKFCQKKGSGNLKSCASFGVDPYGTIKDTAEKEAKKVAGLFNGTDYTDYQATKSTVLKKCIDKDIIHFACHGTFNNADPLSSGVVLHNKVVLSAREIFNMRLTTELVTLSACQTGINERSPGDELIGLTRAFLYAGAPSVIVSLWLADSPSAYELMLEFYNQLKKGADKATALQKAQITIMEKKEYAHPYYWAPFVLIGDWQ